MEKNELLEKARVNTIEAVSLALKIKDGDCKLSILELLEAFAIIKNWQSTYQGQVDNSISHQVRKSSQRWVDVFQKSIDEFDEVFFDFEMEIVLALKSREFTSEEQKFVKIFVEHAAKNSEFSPSWKDYKLG